MKTPWSQKKEQGYVRQERRTASRPGARSQINSGRTWSSLRDVRLDAILGHLLIDNKDAPKGSYRLTDDEWMALKRDANRTPPGCSPAFQIDLGARIRLLVIEEDFWNDLLDYIRRLEGDAK